MKSIFTKLSTLLLCGAVALVGCTDYSEDIQAVDKNVNDLKTEFEGYKTSTAATIAELQSAIDALEAAQEKMAAEYAKKSELETAVTTLQNLVNEKAEALQAALTEAAGKIAALETGKADKTEVEALQAQVTEAIKQANDAIAALDAAKADKTELELVKADVATLIEGYTQTIAALQNLSTALSTVQSDLDVVEEDVESLKTAAAEAVFAITNLQASVDALTVRVETLEEDMAAAKQQIAQHTEALQNLAGRLEAVEGDLEDEAKVRAEADKALQEAVMLLNDGFMNLSFAYNAHVEEMEAYKEILAKEMDDLRAQDSALANSMLSYYDQAIAAVDYAIATLREEIAALRAEIIAAWEEERAKIHNMIDNIQTTLAAWCQENSDAIEALQAQDAALAQVIIENYETLVAVIDKGDADLKTYTDEQIVLVYNTVMDWLNTLNIVIEEKEQALYDAIKKNYTDLAETIEKNNAEIAAQIKDIKNDIDGITKQVEDLLKRVQSLTYIPDFEDHKAAIYYAILTNNQVKTYVSRQSILRYRVHGQDAEATAKQIAETWKTNPEILKFDFETVETRATEAPKASLQIAKVVAKDADLYVYAVAKNFEPKFFDPQLSIYSASLVLTHENNIIASEYTNLRAGNEQEIVAVVLDAEGNDITGRKADDKTAPVELLPYDGQDPTSVNVLEGHRLAFVIDGDTSAYLTIDEMIAAGYDLSLERRVFAKQQVNKTDWNTSDHSSNEGKPGAIREVGPFQLEEVPFTNHNIEGNTKVWLKQPLKKADYKELKANNYNVLYVAFNYFVNGQKVTTEASVVMSNRLVNVDLGAVEVPWTLYGADTLYTTAGAYTKTFKHVGFPYDLTNPKTVNKSLEGYDLYDILQSPLEPGQKLTKSYGSAGYDIQMSIHDKTVDFAISGYNFAKATDTDGWNDHTVKWVRDFDDITVTVKAALKFGKVTDTFTAEEKGLVFKLNGLEGSVYAKSTAIVANMFNKYRALIGIADDAKAKKFFTDVLGRSVVTDDKINKYDLQDWQLTTPIATFDPFGIWMHNSQFNAEGAQTVAVAQKDANTLVNFQFAFEGGIDLPVDGLAYSTVDYVNYNTELKRYEVEVDGDIVSNKYTIDQADLGKYFYVVNEADYGVERTSTVKFEILTKDAPKPAADVVGVAYDEASELNVLNVGQAVIKDWTKAGAFPGNEIEVKATLYVDGFPIDTKNVTLYTVDPLTFVNTIDNPETEEVETWDITRTPGADAIAYTHKVLSLTSVAEEGNLIKTDSTPAKIWDDSKANTKYGAQFVGQYEKYKNYWCNLVEVYTVAADGTHVAYPSNKYLFNNGKVTLLADDGLLNQPIYAKVTYTLTHNFHIGDPTTVTVLVKFVPDNTL